LKSALILLFLSPLAFGGLTESQSKQQIVLPDGCGIQVTSPQGKLVIRAQKDYVRSFEWAGGVRAAKMRPRSAPWYGNLGLFSPGAGWMWWPHDGVTRIVYQEYDLWFPDVTSAEKYLADHYSGDPKWVDGSDRSVAGVWRNDGLLVWWQRQRSAEYLGVTIAQLYVAGKRPEKLKGSRDSDLIFLPKPNQSTDSTLASGTPLAGQESRHP
jgi:hypothetical protein